MDSLTRNEKTAGKVPSRFDEIPFHREVREEREEKLKNLCELCALRGEKMI